MVYLSSYGMIRKSLFFRKSFTFLMISLNILIFFILSPLLFFYPEIQSYIFLKPSDILQGKNVWTIFTSIFMHGNLLHLAVNMFTLFFIGMFCEQLIGKKRIIWLYLFSGIFGSLAFVYFAYLGTFFPLGEKLFGSVDISGVGASGALFGLLGLLAVLIPNQRIYLITGPLIGIIFQVIFSSLGNNFIFVILSYVALIFTFISAFAMFAPFSSIRKISLPLEMKLWVAPFIAIVPLMIIGIFVSLPIGNTAHFGGLLVGLAYGFYLRKKYPKKVALLGRFFK